MEAPFSMEHQLAGGADRAALVGLPSIYAHCMYWICMLPNT